MAPVWDPQAVAICVAAGEGASIALDMGGKTDSPALNMRARPLRVSGTVKRVTNGTFTITCPMQTGLQVCLGTTVLFATDQADILISEQRWEPYDTGCFTHAGVDPQNKKYVLVKSRQHFRAGFEAIAKHIVLVDGPGVCSSDYSQFDFKQVRRPIYPLDVDMEFEVA